MFKVTANTSQSCDLNIGPSASRAPVLNHTLFVTLMADPSGGTQQVEGNTISDII